MYELGGSYMERRARELKPFPFETILTARRLIVGASKVGSKKRWLGLPTNQGYGATCVPASIDKRIESITNITAP